MWKEAATKEELKEVYFDVICYKGRMQDVNWKDEDECTPSHPFSRSSSSDVHERFPAGFKKLCRVEVDLSDLNLNPQSKKDADGNTKEFYIAKYWVVLLFNSAELKAQMVWMDGAVERRCVIVGHVAAFVKLIWDVFRSTASLVFYQD
jgi:hypothetical protein